MLDAPPAPQGSELSAWGWRQTNANDVVDNKLIFTFEGNGFIKYQIRNMVGYLIKIGEGKKKVDSIKEVLESKNRTMASITAHSEGLWLVDVEY